MDKRKKNQTIKDWLNENTKGESGWLDKAKYRQNNKDWLNISFKIAVKTLSALKENKRTGFYPSNVKELSQAMNCTEESIVKVLKGSDKITIDVLVKLEDILNLSILTKIN